MFRSASAFVMAALAAAAIGSGNGAAADSPQTAQKKKKSKEGAATSAYVLSKTETGKFTFVLKAGNGETILRSQTYQSKAAAEGGIASVQKNCGEDDRYEKKESSDGKHFFNLLAANKQVIGTSQMYKTVATRDEGIEAVKKDGKTTTIKSDV